MQAALRGGAPFRLTYRILTATREEKWVWEQGRAVLARERELPALEGFIADITERMATYQLLERRVADRKRELQALYDVTAVASQSLDLKIVLEKSLDRLLAVMGSQLGAIHLLDEAGQNLHLAASQGIRQEDIARISSVAVDQGLVGLVVEDGRPLVLPEIVSGPRPLIAIPAVESQAYLGVPICIKGKVMGVLSVVGETGRPSAHSAIRSARALPRSS